MILRSHDSITQIPQDKECIFLAGSMPVKSEDNWRQRVTGTFQENYNFLDPTNPNHDKLDDREMRKHIKWEFDGLRKANYIIMNFLSDSLSPISMVELGMYISTNKLIVVCPKKFYKWRYIDTLCKEHNTPIFSEIEEVIYGDIESILNTKKRQS